MCSVGEMSKHLSTSEHQHEKRREAIYENVSKLIRKQLRAMPTVGEVGT
jgi:hypothetical protein